MNKPDLLLLHGALGASAQFTSLARLLEEHCRVHTLDFEGHGAAPDRERPFRMEHFVDNVLEYLAARGISAAHIFGYSMGGFVACRLALAHPDKVLSVATLGTKFYWDPEIAARETGFLNHDKIKAKVPHFAALLEARHTAYGWENVLRATADLLNSLGEEGGLRADTLSGLQRPVRVMLGDQDRTVSVVEAHEVYRALPHGELEVLPATTHELERVSAERLAYTLSSYFRA